MKRRGNRPPSLRKFVLISALLHLGILTLLSLSFRIHPIAEAGDLIGLRLVESNPGRSKRASSSQKPAPRKSAAPERQESKPKPPKQTAQEQITPKQKNQEQKPAETTKESIPSPSGVSTEKGTESPGGPPSSGAPDDSPSGNDTIELAHPMYRLNPKPAYPPIAKRRGYEGTVYLRVRVSERGEVERVEIGHSSGYSSLDASAVEAVREWVFFPGRRNGVAVASWVTVPIDYRLEGG